MRWVKSAQILIESYRLRTTPLRHTTISYNNAQSASTLLKAQRSKYAYGMLGKVYLELEPSCHHSLPVCLAGPGFAPHLCKCLPALLLQVPEDVPQLLVLQEAVAVVVVPLEDVGGRVRQAGLAAVELKAELLVDGHHDRRLSTASIHQSVATFLRSPHGMGHLSVSDGGDCTSSNQAKLQWHHMCLNDAVMMQLKGVAPIMSMMLFASY
eukprot:scaffold28812_cov47-Prasinocladus_malaysianus.AAC.1